MLGIKLLYIFINLLMKARLSISLLEKEKFERKISDGKIEIPHKFLGRKI